MTFREIIHPQRTLAHEIVTALPAHGVLVVGYTDTEASRRALMATTRAVHASSRVALVCGMNPTRPPRPDRVGYDALKRDAYLLSDRAILDEQLRRGRETFASGCRATVTSETIEGDPVRVLSDAAIRHQATAVVVGMRGARPSWQVRRIARELPSDVALYATNGDTHIRLRRSARVPVAEHRLVPGSIPGPAGA